MIRALAALALCSCNAVFGVHDTVLADAPPDAAPIDAYLLVDPSGSGTTCGGPLDFSNATFTQIGPAGAVTGLNATGPAGARHLVFARTDGVNPPGVWDWDLASSPSEIVTLAQGAVTGSLGLSPDDNVVWFTSYVNSAYYATRASNWMRQPTELGIVDPQFLGPGRVGLYGGTARMVLAITPTGTTTQLVEISSPDGLSWTKLDTIQFTPPGASPQAASLSADGCILTFNALDTQFQTLAYIAYRDASGNFSAAPTLLPAPAGTANAYLPSLTADLAELWMVASDSAGTEMFVRATR